MSQVSVTQLFEKNKEKLCLQWGESPPATDRQLENHLITSSTQELIGHLNFVHPNWIQVLNQTSVKYLEQLDDFSLQKRLNQLARSQLACLIVADDAPIPYSIRQFANEQSIPLIRSTIASLEIIWGLQTYLVRVLAPVISRHGVLLDVLGMGVMITGESGVGKSELALELISRGHGLVADDVVELRRIGPETLEGKCPPLLRDFLEVRGLGMLNIRTIFGETAIRRHKNMKLIVQLEKTAGSNTNVYERLPLSNFNEIILNVSIRKVTIPVAAGRNLAVLVEAAVRNYILQLRGIDSTREFVCRHESEMNGNTAEHFDDPHTE
ncbi:HPr kinase/phosphorylase [Nitrosomonas sp. HPC101]|uniref:HPr(Ser) kinase/phosphatase n=1 Tax=Nitrosomonas sp. HPC101 TaxID=1658667 RepID=UPI00136A86F7|nr:HPr(Ser) kinase/phosphatase [Nitrosomonas sp. HPC101]MXS86110.1 HPr kinase/phosphorylase [Nitrosomonas sp. HPC101]